MTFAPEGGSRLQLRSCFLKQQGSKPVSLRCEVEGSEPLTLCRLAPGVLATRTKVAGTFSAKTKFTAVGEGEVLLSGLLVPEIEGLAALAAAAAKRSRASESGEAPPAKAAKTEPQKANGVAPESKAESKAKAQVEAKPEAKKVNGANVPNGKVEANGAASSNGKAAAKAEPKAEAKKTNGAAPSNGKVEDAKKASAPAESNGKAEAAPNAKSKGKEEKPKTPVTRRTLSSGLQYEVLKPGNGPVAASGKTVQVRYEGYLTNGHRFDKGTIKFRLGLGEVIKGWDEGVKGMLRGEQRRLLVPARLGYGVQGAPPVIPPNAALVFEVQLLNC